MYEENKGNNTNHAIKGTIENSNFYNLYIAPHQACKTFDQAVEALKENPEMLELFLKENNTSVKDLEGSIMDLVASVNSSMVDAEVLYDKFKAVQNHKDVTSANLTEENLQITLTDGTVINSKSLSKTMGWDDEVSDYVRSSHQMNIELTQTLPYESRIVTGWVYGETDKFSKLHTWLEAYIDGKVVVIDSAIDAIMNKNGYYRLRGAREISAINNFDLKSDIQKITPYIRTGQIANLQYLILRNKIMTILNENEQ